MPVYILRAGETDKVKIGFSLPHVLTERLRGLQGSNHERLTMLRLLEGDRKAEFALHRKFANHRLHGEWFFYVPAMLEDLGLPDLELVEVPLPGAGHTEDRRRRFGDQIRAAWANPTKRANWLRSFQGRWERQRSERAAA